MSNIDRIAAARPLIKVLQVAGIWPAEDMLGVSGSHRARRFWRKCHVYLLHLPLTITYIMLMWLQLLSSQSLFEAGNLGGPTLTETTLLIKLLYIWLKKKQAWQYVENLETNAHFELRNQNERTMWQQAQRRFKRFVLMYVGLSLGVVTSAHIGVLFLDEYKLPFDFWLPFECNTPLNYWAAYTYESLAMPFTCLLNSTLDMLVCYFLFHLAMLYKLVGSRLATLHQWPADRIEQKFKGIMRMHRDVNELSKVCESLVSAPIMSQVIFSALILCFIGYSVQHLNIAENLGYFLAMLQYVIVMTVEIFLPCYYANEVQLNSDRLTTQLYSCEWLEFSPAMRRYMYIFMEFLKRPIRIRACSIFEIGLPVFTKTINNAYSFFAILLNMDEAENNNP